MDKKFIGPLMIALAVRERTKRQEQNPANPRSGIGMAGKRGTGFERGGAELERAKKIAESGSLEPTAGQKRMIKANMARLVKGRSICLVSFLGMQSLDGYRRHLKNDLRVTLNELEVRGEVDMPGPLLPEKAGVIVMDVAERKIAEIAEFARGAKQAGMKVVLVSRAGSRNIPHDRLYNPVDDADFAKLDLLVIELLREVAKAKK